MSKWLVSALLAINVLGQTPAADTAAGKKIFESQCALCHGQTGTGGRGPSLNRVKLNHAPDDEALWKVISGGIEPEMPGAWQLNPHEVYSVAAYVRSLGAILPKPSPAIRLAASASIRAKDVRVVMWSPEKAKATVPN